MLLGRGWQMAFSQFLSILQRCPGTRGQPPGPREVSENHSGSRLCYPEFRVRPHLRRKEVPLWGVWSPLQRGSVSRARCGLWVSPREVLGGLQGGPHWEGAAPSSASFLSTWSYRGSLRSKSSAHKVAQRLACPLSRQGSRLRSQPSASRHTCLGWNKLTAWYFLCPFDGHLFSYVTSATGVPFFFWNKFEMWVYL